MGRTGEPVVREWNVERRLLRSDELAEEGLGSRGRGSWRLDGEVGEAFAT
jgi:hypothetical protein